MSKRKNKSSDITSLDIYNLKSFQQLLRIIKNPELPVEYRQTVVATIGGEIGALLAAIIGVVFPMNIQMVVLAIVAALQTPIVFIVIGYITKESNGAISKYVATVLYILELPLIYFFSGGFKGPGLYWFLFAVLIATLVCPRKQAFIEVTIAFLVQMATFAVSMKKPELALAVDMENARHNTVFSCFSIAIAIFAIMYLQKGLSNANVKYLKQLKAEADMKNDELTVAKEELTAQNEEMAAMNDELSETSHKLSELLDENRRAFEQHRRFTAMLNHELRNPLNGIMGYLQLQMLDQNIPEQYKKEIKDSYSLTESMLQTVNDILDFSKMQEGKFEIVTTDFDFNEIVHNVHTIFDEMAAKKGLKLEYIMPDRTYTMYSDGIRIQQIIVNLMSNSIKYTRKGKVAFEAAIDETNSLLNLKISDTGCGMTADEVAYIFEPYKRFDLENNKKIQGTGLGMSIVKNLVDQLEGTINIESEVGIGTTFTLTIPVIIDMAATERKQAEENASMDLSGKVILTVDDDEINLQILSMFLEKTNAIVINAKDGREALDIIELGDYKVDCIITDNFMPKMTGVELRRFMKEHDMNIPSIILSGDADADAKAEFTEVGFDEVLLKPVVFDRLASALKKML